MNKSRKSTGTILLAVSYLIFIFWIATFSTTPLLNALEEGLGLLSGTSLASLGNTLLRKIATPLSIRIFLSLTAYFSALAVAHLFFRFSPDMVEKRSMCIGLLVCYGILCGVWVFDQEAFHLEASAITKFSSLVLCGTSLLAFYNMRLQRGSDKKHLRLLWGLLCAAFLFAAADELFTFHERAVLFLEGVLHLSPKVTDAITFSYGIGGLLFVAYFWSSFRDAYIKTGSMFFKVFISAILLFIASSLFDTFDYLCKAGVQKVVAHLHGNAGVTISERFYPFYSIAAFLNSVEEMLEFLAATVFGTSFFIALLESPESRLREIIYRARWWKMLQISPRRNMQISLSIIGLSVVLLVMAGVRWNRPGRAHVVKGYGIETLAGPSAGLFHSDGIWFDDSLGLLCANEGGKNVLLFKEGKPLREILNAEDGLIGPDNVIVYDNVIIVSDESKKIFYHYPDSVTRSYSYLFDNDTIAPEGIAVDSSGHLYICSEVTGCIYRVHDDDSVTVFADLRSSYAIPEEIAFAPGGEMMVTDDINGHVLAIEADGTITVVADFGDGLRQPEGITVARDGVCYITDSFTGNVYQLSEHKEIRKIASFTRMYSDLQGIAVDARGSLYIVSSDGWGSISWMPSIIYRLRKKI